MQLAHSLSLKKLGFNPRTDLQSAIYRDDNRYFWEFEEFDFNKAAGAGYESVKQVRKNVNVMEMANEVEVEGAGDDAQEIWVLSTELFPYEDMGISWNEMEGKEPVSPIRSTIPNGITRSSWSVRPGRRCWKSAPRPATCR